jgi:hypothetical protein
VLVAIRVAAPEGAACACHATMDAMVDLEASVASTEG